ncbi:pyruvate kinase [Nisaea nitritireducens]|uniref:pyruvate kinase n=1 Tax=Nisaea nitritireducens TaxID=568392 RepID=UPI001865BEE6|nr:pyruvate kinase [Nisaea nitritireducens]
MRRYRNTKIVATLGPASSTPKRIEELFRAGVDVFRLNFSHGSHRDHAERLRVIRDLEKTTGRPIAVMADLQGPKLRIGSFTDGKIELKAGAKFRLDLDRAPGDQKRVCLPHTEIFEAIHKGTDLLLDDGKIRLTVTKCGDGFAETKVITGGPLSNNKGVNVPNVMLGLSPLSAKDRTDLSFALSIGVDWVALSFVQRPEDVAEARKLIGDQASIIVKLEKPQAIDRLEEICELTDSVMVARGDLGVEMPPEKVPMLQKRIIKLCRSLGKPVVVATQMLDSMVSSPTPTRAEASDVATAVYDSADAVMLSAESAAGEYPVEAVEMMNRIIREVEGDQNYRQIINASHDEPDPTVSDAITLAARQVAETVNASCIVTYTTSGSTTVRASRERPAVPILCVTANERTARRLAMAWGVHAVHVEQEQRFSAVVKRAVEVAKAEEFGGAGDKIVITAGVPMGTPGSTNVLRVERIL